MSSTIFAISISYFSDVIEKPYNSGAQILKLGELLCVGLPALREYIIDVMSHYFFSYPRLLNVLSPTAQNTVIFKHFL